MISYQVARYNINISRVDNNNVEQIDRVEFKYNRPIITSRSVETEVSVWDGESVVIGGMISEKVNAFDDSIPYLSEVPFLGRLFRSKGEISTKSNLMIFVTARLVTPGGAPVNKTQLRGIPDYNRI